MGLLPQLRVCVKKSTQERFALKILIDRPKARNEVMRMSMFSHKSNSVCLLATKLCLSFCQCLFSMTVFGLRSVCVFSSSASVLVLRVCLTFRSSGSWSNTLAACLVTYCHSQNTSISSTPSHASDFSPFCPAGEASHDVCSTPQHCPDYGSVCQ